MFEALKNITLLCVKGTIDLLIGSTTALMIEHIFPFNQNDQSPKLEQLSLEIFLQTSLTLLVGIETRNLFFSEQDTMGAPFGIMFILSLFIQQGYWQKVHLWQSSVAKMIFEKSNPGS